MKHKYVVVLVFAMLVQSLYVSCRASSVDNFVLRKPLVYISANISGCVYDVRLNDVSIISDKEGFPIDTQAIPVNQWASSEKNTLSIDIAPVKDAVKLTHFPETDCHVIVKLIMKQDEGDGPGTTLTSIDYQSSPVDISENKLSIKASMEAGQFKLGDNHQLISSKSGPINVSAIAFSPYSDKYGKGVKVSREVQMSLPMPKWKWMSGEVIKNNDETKNQLLKIYKRIWNALKDHQTATVMPMFDLRNKEYAEAFYTSPHYFQDKLNLAQLASDPQLELVPIVPKYVELKIFGNGRLAELVAWDGETPIIVSNYKDGSAHVTTPLIFSKIKGKWVLVR